MSRRAAAHVTGQDERTVPPEPSLQRDEGGGLRGAHTRTAVLDGLVGDGELGEVVADHLGLYLNVDVLLAIVDAHDAAYHLWHDHHVPQVRLHSLGLLTVGGLALGLAQLLEECDRLPLDAAAEFPALARAEELHQVLVAHVKELIEVDATVGVLAEGALL